MELRTRRTFEWKWKNDDQRLGGASQGQYNLVTLDKLQPLQADGLTWEDVPVVCEPAPEHPHKERDRIDHAAREQKVIDLINNSPTLSQFLADKNAAMEKKDSETKP